jgi:hypothetical protein
MSLAESIGFCALLIGVVGFAAKLAVESEVLDVLALVGCAVAVGYMGKLL